MSLMIDVTESLLHNEFKSEPSTGITETVPETPFCWPSSAPPSSINQTIAVRLCQDFITSDVVSIATPYNNVGWSAQDCIKVSFSSDQSYLVEIPRQANAATILACNNEAARAKWASSRGIGPSVVATDISTGAFAMEFIDGQTLSIETALLTSNLSSTIELLQRINHSPVEPWMCTYHAPIAVKKLLHTAHTQNCLEKDDDVLMERLIGWACAKFGETAQTHLLVPFHNDFHTLNIMFDTKGSWYAIDFEDCNLGHPM